MPPVGAALEVIAPDAIFLYFSVSDGDVSRRPDNMKQPSSSAKEVNWFRSMRMDEKYVCRWRNLIGQGIAMLMNKPNKEKYCLGSWPEGYWMFDHNKGAINAPRHDLYLFGSKLVLRFRSPAEFIPHGFWLFTDASLNRSNCRCKYCGGSGTKSQSEISENLGLPTNRGATLALQTSSGIRMRIGVAPPRRPHIQKTSSNTEPSIPLPSALPSDSPWIPRALRRRMKPEDGWLLTSLNLKFAASNTRLSDLTSPRKFRVGELVWCPYEEEKGNIFYRSYWPYWPAIVIDFMLHADAEVFDAENGVYSVVQTRRCSLLRLGAFYQEQRPEFECIVDDTDVLPWHAFILGADLSSMDQNEQTASFLVAIRTAEHLIRSWAVFNRQRIEIYAESDNKKHGSKRMSQTSLPSVSEIKSELVGRDSARYGTPKPFAIDLGGDFPQSSPSRLAALSPVKRTRSLTQSSVSSGLPGAQSSFVGTSWSSLVPIPKRIEIRYEGIWYGAERIWVGDIIRLSPERNAFSESLRLSWHETACPLPSPGAELRSVLMRIDRIFVRLTEEGSKEIAIAGPLYEVALKDWQDPIRMSFEQESIDNSQAEVMEDVMINPWDPSKHPSAPSKEALVLGVPSAYPLPPAPPGYTLRPLLPEGSEFPAPLSFLAGRYYPDLFQWLPPDLLPPKRPDNKTMDFDCLASSPDAHLLSLCGLAPGRFNHAVCEDVCLANRTKMVDDAALSARGELEAELGDDKMDID
ncbi:hypothetical protein M422DRAFT_23536 [Sphaerobolus stellatus SS14]|nr:hypothetical protein M422DRAFT_23536 [Sphaerobolus stellatus SS14]